MLLFVVATGCGLTLWRRDLLLADPLCEGGLVGAKKQTNQTLQASLHNASSLLEASSSSNGLRAALNKKEWLREGQNKRNRNAQWLQPKYSTNIHIGAAAIEPLAFFVHNNFSQP